MGTYSDQDARLTHAACGGRQGVGVTTLGEHCRVGYSRGERAALDRVQHEPVDHRVRPVHPIPPSEKPLSRGIWERADEQG